MINKEISRRSFLTVSAMTAATLALDWRKISAYAAKMGPKGDYPTVIIGAGLGGLCCAAHLARQGIPVTVVEQHNVPGGYATSFDRAGGKFTFEVSLHGTSINNNGGARMLKNLGVLEKLQLVELPDVYRLKTPDLDISVPQKDPEAYIRLLTRHFPAEAEGIRGFVEEMIGIAEEADRLHKKGGFFKLIFPIQYRKMWNVRNKTLADLMNEYVKVPALQDVLAALWGYYGLPPSKLSGFYYAVATGGYLKNGSYYTKQRSQDLSYALADVIENSGGEIVYETSAEKILVKDKAVTGVAISGGKVLPARAVISNASALGTFKHMLPQNVMPADYLEKLEGYKPSISSFIVWLGLNKELRGQINGSGIHVASGRGSEADYRAGHKEAYNKEKERWTNILIRKAEEHVIPGLSSMIEVKEAATPLTNWRYTRNPEGAIYGFEQSMNNAYMNRIENRAPVKGLYLASAWGSPGGGFTGVLRGGESAFEKIMEDWGG